MEFAGPNHKRLYELTQSGLVVLNYVISGKRTLSSATQISLTQKTKNMCYEPFEVDRDFEKVCGSILNELESDLPHASATNPVEICVKDHASDIGENLHRLMPLVRNFAFIVRDPFLQTVSLRNNVESSLKSSVKDLSKFKALFDTYKESSGKRDFFKKNIERGVKAVGLVAKAIKRRLAPISESILKPNLQNWQSLSSALVKAQEHVIDNPEKRLMVIDALSLKFLPELTMQSLAEEFGWLDGLNQQSQGALVHKVCRDWTYGVGKDFHSPTFLVRDTSGNPTSNWHAEAATSKSFKPINPTRDKPETPDTLGREIYEHILRVLEIYVEIICADCKQGILPYDKLSTTDPSCKKTLPEINPISSYVIATLDHFKGEGDKKDIRSTLRRNNPEYAEAFDTIDRSVERKAASSRLAAKSDFTEQDPPNLIRLEQRRFRELAEKRQNDKSNQKNR